MEEEVEEVEEEEEEVEEEVEEEEGHYLPLLLHPYPLHRT